MTWPSVSIGITTRNRRAMVLRAIESVQRQDYAGPIEIVVVDDHSEDDTVEALTPLSAAGAIKLYPNEERFGIAYSKNQALLRGTGELRGILDDDDYYAPGFISACVKALRSHPEVGLVYTDNVLVNEAGKRIEDWPALDWSLSEFVRTRNLRGDSWLAWWSTLERTTLHDEMFELEADYDLFYQLAEICEFRRIPEALQFVTRHSARTSSLAPERAAYWHAVGLGKYGHPISHAVERSRQFGKEREWSDVIKSGYGVGLELGRLRALKIRRLPRPNANNLAKWESLWSQTGGSQHWCNDARVADLLQWIPQRSCILDLGCGDGGNAASIRIHRPDAEVWGADFAAGMVKRAAERWPDITWRVFDLERDAEGLGARFDVISCCEVIEHLRNPLALFRVARANLERSGYLLLTTPLVDDVRDSLHVWAFSPVDIDRMAQIYGGRVLSMQKTGDAWRTVLYVVAFS